MVFNFTYKYFGGRAYRSEGLRLITYSFYGLELSVGYI